MKLGDIMQPVRVALTGGTVSEPVNELLAVVGPGGEPGADRSGGLVRRPVGPSRPSGPSTRPS